VGLEFGAAYAMLSLMARCPICRRLAAPRTQNTAFPFCSPRCKQIDLGNWLDEKYRVPCADAPEAGRQETQEEV
jgi:endogenous inhibitor of DNA gyrase (YacG/DUF329 family)